MKKILFVSLLSVALVGCGGKDDSKSKAAATAPALSGKLSQDQNSCPNLSGTYGDDPNTVSVDTQIVGGVHEYTMTIDGKTIPYVPADGQVHTTQGGSYRVVCGQNSFEYIVRRDGQADVDLIIRDLGNNEISMEANGQSVTLAKQGATPAPAPQPQPVPGQPASSCPVLNGTYANDSGTDTIYVSTKVEGSSYGYKFSADQAVYLPADNYTHQLPNNQGTYSVGCSSDGGRPSVSLKMNITGRDPISVQLTDLGDGSVMAHANGQSEVVRKR